jgi:hypothetical protein
MAVEEPKPKNKQKQNSITHIRVDISAGRHHAVEQHQHKAHARREDHLAEFLTLIARQLERWR